VSRKPLVRPTGEASADRRSRRRAAIQIGFLIGIGALLAWHAGPPAGIEPATVVLSLDPLLAAATTLATFAAPPLLALSLALVVFTTIFGRLFCSHACPVGTLVDAADALAAPLRRRLGVRIAPGALQWLRVGLLLAVLAAAAAGLDLLGYVDPLVLTSRLVAPLATIAGAPNPLAATAREATVGSPAWTPLLLALVLGSAPLVPRAWCRLICPLGTLLGWLAAKATRRRRVSEACTACEVCAAACPMGAVRGGGRDTAGDACTACGECISACPRAATTVAFAPTGATGEGTEPAPSLSRRSLAGAMAGGVAVGVGLALGLGGTRGTAAPRAAAIRPPGALPETDFVAACARCGACQGACPTGTLRPAGPSDGLAGWWLPRLDLRAAPCDRDCTRCGDACPTGSLRTLDPAERRHAAIGTAVLLRDRCLPWADDRPCTTCQKRCPYGAIAFTAQSSTGLGLPVVDPTRCDGCGVCENACPVEGRSAIVVVADGALRLASGSFADEARARGLRLEASAPPTEPRPPIETGDHHG
jgi:MauM/NapG family ferredoxin protein